MARATACILLWCLEGLHRLIDNEHHYYRSDLHWCEDNADKPLAEKTFGNTLRQSERKWGIAYDKNLDIGYDKRARGYRGVHTLVNTDYQ